MAAVRLRSPFGVFQTNNISIVWMKCELYRLALIKFLGFNAKQRVWSNCWTKSKRVMSSCAATYVSLQKSLQVWTAWQSCSLIFIILFCELSCDVYLCIIRYNKIWFYLHLEVVSKCCRSVSFAEFQLTLESNPLGNTFHHFLIVSICIYSHIRIKVQVR